MSNFEPEAFGKYYLIDKIATGGMAEIFRAKTYSHGGFENLIVIKRILAHLGQNEEFVEMFIDEAKVSVALQHANIVRIYDFGKMIDNYFIAMECVDGKDVRGILRKLSRKRRFLPVEFAAYIAHETCRGLDYAHHKRDLQGNPYGIVHRDISPSNILVSYEGDIKVADFGIAKAEHNTYTTADGVLKGKFEYMSPEQARGESLNHQSDLFSLGIILYEMLTGRRLFKTDSDIATLEKIKSGDFEPPSQVNARVPERLERIVMKALAPTKDRRYPHAKAMQDDLLEFLFPATPDITRGSLARFMQGLFADEIDDERARLTTGSKIAEQLRDAAPLDPWDGQTNSTVAGHPRAGSAALPFLGVGLVLLLMGGAISAALVAWVMVTPSDPDIIIKEVAITTGMLDITVVPTGLITINGELKGDHTSLTLQDVVPGEYSVLIEAQGREPHTETVRVAAGQMSKVRHIFTAPRPQAVVAPPPTQPSPQAPGPARVRFKSTPTGANVFVNNQLKGKTPMTWTGRPGRSYTIEYQMAGHDASSGQLSGLKAGEMHAFSLDLNQAAAVPTGDATLVIAIAGGGWGDVFIDGSKIEQRAPISATKGVHISPGSHTIQVKNPGSELDWSGEVQCSAGAQCKVRVTRN